MNKPLFSLIIETRITSCVAGMMDCKLNIPEYKHKTLYINDKICSVLRKLHFFGEIKI
jgi:hypothetical protein